MILKQIFIISLSGYLLSSCSSSKQLNQKQLISVKAGHLIALDMAPLFVGVESGCFEKNGLAVETVFFTNPGDNNAALAGSAVDFSTNPFTLPFFAASSGVPIKTISAAGGWGVMQVIAKSKYNIKSLKELKDFIEKNPDNKLKIATLRGDTLELILIDAFKKQELSPENFEMVYFDDLLAMVDAFRLNKVDILSHIKPYTTQFIANGEATAVTDNAEVWSSTTPNTVVSVLEKTLKEKPVVVEAYLKGLQCGAEIINNRPEEAASLLEKGNYYQVKKTVLLTAFKSQPTPITFTPDTKTVQSVVDEMVELKYINTNIPASKIFATSIIQKLEQK